MAAAGDSQEVAAPVEEVGVGAGAAAGDAGVLGGGDAADEAEGEVGAHNAAQGSGAGVLGGSHDVDTGFATALDETGQGAGDGAAADHHKVGELIDEDDDARDGAGVINQLTAAIADLHGADQGVEGFDGLAGIRDEGAGEMGSVRESAEGAALGIDAEEAEGARGVGEGERDGHSAEEDGLAGAGGAGEEDVGNVRRGETGEQGDASIGKAEDGGGRGDGLDILEEREEGDGPGFGIGEGEDDTVLIAADGEGGDAHSERKIVGKAADGGEAGEGSRGEEEANQAGPNGAAGDPARSTVCGQHCLDAIGLVLQIGFDLCCHMRHLPTV